MAGGQAIDLESVGKSLTRPELETMHRAKTGALLRAAVVLGATAAHTPPDRPAAAGPQGDVALERFAAAVGLAFQVVDDVLDVETDSAILGKTAGKDAMNDKPTVVTTLGLDRARSRWPRRCATKRNARSTTFGARGRSASPKSQTFIIGQFDC